VIRVRRPPAPAIFAGKTAEAERRQAVSFYKPTSRPGRLKVFPFKLHRRPEVHEALTELFESKCAYCETPSTNLSPIETGRHRPVARALGLDGSVAEDHYWWLAIEWANLLPICADCDRAKGSRFPVVGNRSKPGTSVRGEKPLLLDPCRDSPEKHLVFSEDGLVHSMTDRGQTTIELLSLNRTGLVSERRRTYKELLALMKRVERILGGDLDDPDTRASLAAELKLVRRGLRREQPFGALCRQFINRWLNELGRGDMGELDVLAAPLKREAAQRSTLVSEAEERDVAEKFVEHVSRQQSYSVETEDVTEISAFYSGAKRLEWFEIENFKGIERLNLEFPTAKTHREPWLMLLGENGCGKSSVLQALAITLMGESHASEMGLEPERFRRVDAGRRPTRVRVKLTNIPEPIVLRVRGTPPKFVFETPDPKVLLLGYGATRLLRRRPRSSDVGPSYVRVKNLFDPTAPLDDVEAWLLDRKAINAQRFGAIGAALGNLLMLDTDERLTRQPGEIRALVRGRASVPLRQLSDGFQSVVSLSADIMKILLERWPSVQDAEGIVLLDELEAHLHPSWKIEIVDRLRRAFPRVSFIATTHDPLCLKGLDDGEIVVFRRDEERRVFAETGLPSVNDLRADQILTSPLFGLHSTRGDDAAAAIDRYAVLTGKELRSPAEEAERSALQGRLQQTISPQETELQRVVERAIGETLLTQASTLGLQAATPTDAAPELLELRRQLGELLGSPVPPP
jgi:uncharacterized protein (TIGR02646 family)